MTEPNKITLVPAAELLLHVDDVAPMRCNGTHPKCLEWLYLVGKPPPPPQPSLPIPLPLFLFLFRRADDFFSWHGKFERHAWCSTAVRLCPARGFAPARAAAVAVAGAEEEEGTGPAAAGAIPVSQSAAPGEGVSAAAFSNL